MFDFDMNVTSLCSATKSSGSVFSLSHSNTGVSFWVIEREFPLMRGREVALSALLTACAAAGPKPEVEKKTLSKAKISIWLFFYLEYVQFWRLQASGWNLTKAAALSKETITPKIIFFELTFSRWSSDLKSHRYSCKQLVRFYQRHFVSAHQYL